MVEIRTSTTLKVPPFLPSQIVPRPGLAIATTARPNFPSVTSLTVAAHGRSGPMKFIIAGTSRQVKRIRFLVAVRNMESAPFCTE